MPDNVGFCAICLEGLDVPAALTCGHVFCLECFDDYSASIPRNKPTVCPTCRAPYSGRPIKLYLSSEDDARKSGKDIKHKQKSWADATLPVPFFAELHLKNLREDLSDVQTKYEASQRQLESALIEKRQVASRNRRMSAERDQAVQERDSLLKEKETFFKERALFIQAGRQLETTMLSMRSETEELRAKLSRAHDLIEQYQIERIAKETIGRAKRDNERRAVQGDAASSSISGPILREVFVRDPPTKRPAAAPNLHNPLITVTPSRARGAKPARATPPASIPATTDRPVTPTLPASMSLDEILAGGLRKYMPSRQNAAHYPI